MKLSSRKWSLFLSVTLIIAFSGLVLRSQSGEKKLAVFSPTANYNVSVAEYENHEYVGLIDLLEPLGKVEARGDSKWKVQFTPAGTDKPVELEFEKNKRRVRLRNVNLDLPFNFVLNGGRGYVPIASLSGLLPRLFDLTVQVHENGRRLFIGTSGIKFGTDLKKNPSRLILNFPGPVSPFIATEGGRVRMVFTREPVVFSGADAVSFGDPLIASVNFKESNGAAEIVVNGTAPLFASFADNGRTITVAAAPQQAATPPLPVPQPSATPPSQPAPAPTTVQPAPASRFLVVIDAGHGGEERGAALTETLAEKDVTLAFARRVLRELENKGVNASLIRGGDSFLSFDQRAIAANTQRPAAYISIHADMIGNGVRIYTGLMPPVPPVKKGTFLPWESAQSSFLDSSSAVAGSVAAECNTRKIPVRAMAAAIRPLNSIATAAIAVELAPPPEGGVEEITSEKYQQSVAAAIAAGVVAVRQRLEAPR